MLNGILTTALQIIIVLDICGLVLYFLMSGNAKGNDQRPQHVDIWCISKCQFIDRQERGVFIVPFAQMRVSLLAGIS